MESRVAAAKIGPPALPSVVPRERLFGALDRRRRGCVHWIAGPPGAGKTTLVASYLEARGMRRCWYRIDARDADVGNFFHLLDCAAGVRVDREPFSPRWRDDVEGFARVYFQRLFAQLGESFVLVLDNYQLLPPTSAVHTALLAAVAELPSEGSIVVTSRESPPPALVRLRAERRIDSIGWPELQLTRAESDAMVRAAGRGYGEPQLAALHRRTDGWAVALVLLLDPLLARDSIDDLPAEVVFDYMAEEWFESLDRDAREVLIGAAFLPEIDPDAAAVLSGCAGAAAVLARLHRDHHLVSRSACADGDDYQFHPLLAEFLQQRAERARGASGARRLRRETARVLEGHQRVDHAAALFEELRDWRALARLAERNAPIMLGEGRAETLEQWIEALPRGVRDARPWLLYWQAQCRFLAAPREARLLYQHASDRFAELAPQDLDGAMLTCAGAMEAVIHELDDFSLLDRWIATVNGWAAAGQRATAADVEARLTAAMFMALVFRQPQHPDIGRWAESAVRGCALIEDAGLRLSTQLLVAINLNYTGQFEAVGDFLRSMRRTCRGAHASALAMTVLKDIESMRGMLTADYRGALDAVYEGLAVAERETVIAWIGHLISNGVAAALGSGDIDTARALLARMDACTGATGRLDRCNFHYYSAWLAMLEGDLVGGLQHQKTALRLAVECGCPFYEVLCRLALALVLDASGEPRRAAAQLRVVRTLARAVKNHLLEFTCLLVYAHIALRNGRERSATNALRCAFGLGREHGFRHFLWWLPEMVSGLCAHALANDVEPVYVRALVRERALIPRVDTVRAADWPWRYRVRTLGGFSLQRDDAPLGRVTRMQQRPLELLKCLIALGGDEVPESAVAAAMWPRIDSEYAHRSLTTALHRLRKLLGEDAVVVLRRARLSLDWRYCWTDARALELAVAEIDLTLAGGAGRERNLAAHAEELLGLYRGAFLAGERDQPVYVAARERHRSRFLRGLGDVCRWFEERGCWDRPVGWYRRAIEVDPLAEGLHRRLMLCYRECGRHAEAIEAYEACCRTVRAELGIEPSPETAAIHRSLLAGL